MISYDFIAYFIAAALYSDYPNFWSQPKIRRKNCG